MKPYRSLLFVPGHKPTWADKALASGTDAVILDLEDSVPAGDKADARKTVAETLDRLADAARADLWVRPNSSVSGLLGADLEAVVRPGLAGLFLPKVFDAQEIVRIDAVVSHLEEREGLAPGSVGLIVSYETAVSMAHCEEIATASPRVASLLGATGPNADVGRELGFEFTPAGLETLYLRSRIVLAARAAGLHHPLAGVWQDIRDLDGFRRFCEDNRGLGYRGMVCIHPSHVAVANEVFTPSPEKVEFYRRMIDAFRKAEAEGSAAVDFEGQHIDLAHVKTAEGVIELAEAVARHG
ncbi:MULTISPECIES: HpcH/HpaI aldolase/citrate lyase family protein [Amycolatopsis]|uniref:Citrate lyase subunit beta/citryl-CoA lyase n=1 Tax=Amycolatopsis thermophila TaxID=206084 RepID=A0ABU0F5D1_9PSEU|nr:MULTISPECIES: CoA ester lyase [Amycolatopsis]MDQ0382539.1 citrate lyase subunit beta/citryl-CoA lyase [Amycolatopsis thermophila]